MSEFKDDQIIFECIMDAFKKNVATLMANSPMDSIAFTVPKMRLSKKDMMDLSLMVAKKINAIVEFNFKKGDGIIEVVIRRVGVGVNG